MKINLIKCDVCKKRIQTSDSKDDNIPAEAWIDAGTYGIEAHVDCFEHLTVRQVLKLLTIDEIRYVTVTGETEKYIYRKTVV